MAMHIRDNQLNEAATGLTGPMVQKISSFRLKWTFLIPLVALFLAAFSSMAYAERRAAIVVGNGEYKFAPLANPKNDSKLIAATLTELGFDVLLFYDVKKAAVDDLENAIRTHLLGAEMSILYYAGHALQHDGRNLLLPVDVRTGSAKEVIDDAIALNSLIDIVKDDPVGVKLVILDACRNNPLTAKKGLEEGLANIEAGAGQVLIAFATGAGEVAYDGTGVNSPYSSALANALQQPGLDIYDTFRTVRGDVRLATNGSQIPWITGSIETKFVFRANDLSKAPSEVTAANEALTIDQVLWYFIQDSPDPTDFERFVKAFPKSQLAEEALKRSKLQIAALNQRGLFVTGALAATSISTEPPAGADTAAAGAEFVFQQAGERAVSETFRIWPREMPATGSGMKTLVTDCDLYAADPNDPQRVVPGVTNGLVNVRDGLRACGFALAGDPTNPRLQYQFGRVLEIARRYDWAEHFYELAGEQQYSAALVNLGYMARVGMGREVDYKRAFDLYMKAASLGNLRARTNVGSAYIRGQGVPKIPEEGILWYKLAASSGWSNAINALGDSFRRGTGVKKDDVEAAKLYAAAADAGQIDAINNLGRAYVSGLGVQKDVKRGLDLMLRATEMGNQYAPFYAARLLLKGDGEVSRDTSRALALFELSARRGFEDAYLELSKGYAQGSFARGKPDLRRAYFNALLAARFKVDKAEQTLTSVGEKLDATARKAVEGEVELFVQQNGL
ncbi:putative caspase-like protein/TPR repeat protein [Sinorhizobium kostiense]|uniref:Caspase-like protein/TPR repeat protein n=1 Tax=Sinorhizobium kostiense TaxID=76747 RepID=A0ABS4QVX8_9HYPH|nr:putative caspase-like protein/TPR repeat protein [Sinorhizobium kostiense]